jgi:hypothetical protein
MPPVMASKYFIYLAETAAAVIMLKLRALSLTMKLGSKCVPADFGRACKRHSRNDRQNRHSRGARGNRSGFSKMMAGSAPASIRFAMCRRDMTLDALASAVESVSVASQVDLDKVIAANSMTRVTPAGERGNAILADL